MNNTDLEAVIEYAGGYKYILGFRFANGYKLAYSPRNENDTEYKLKKEDLININGVDYIRFEHHDHNDNRAYSLIPTENLNQIYYMTDNGICMRDVME